MAAPTHFIQGITSATINAQVPTSILRVRWSDGTQQNSEGYDDDASDTYAWNGTKNGTGTVEARDPAQIGLLSGQKGDFVVVANNTKNGGSDQTFTFGNAAFGQIGGDIQGGNNAPGTFSVNFRFGELTSPGEVAT